MGLTCKAGRPASPPLQVADLDTQNGVGATDEQGKSVRLRNRLSLVECTDANGNTPLSEAAGGGHPEAIQMLIDNGANPNSRVRCWSKQARGRRATARSLGAGERLD